MLSFISECLDVCKFVFVVFESQTEEAQHFQISSACFKIAGQRKEKEPIFHYLLHFDQKTEKYRVREALAIFFQITKRNRIQVAAIDCRGKPLGKRVKFVKELLCLGLARTRKMPSAVPSAILQKYKKKRMPANIFSRLKATLREYRQNIAKTFLSPKTF